MLETHNISKSYGPIEALKNVTLNFSENKIYGLFGRNGAGKTTLLDIISTRIFADTGLVKCQAVDITRSPQNIMENLCYMPERNSFPAGYKVKTLLRLSQLSFPNYSKEMEEKLVRLFKVNINQKFDKLSRGYQSIIKIIIGMASYAPITIFDEPVLGLDAVSRDQFYRILIEDFSMNPRMFILSTHFIEESADLFDEAIIIKEGKIIKQESVESLLENCFYVSGKSEKVNQFTKDLTVLSTQNIHGMKTVVVEGNINNIETNPELSYSKLTMQKLFIQLVGDQEVEVSL